MMLADFWRRHVGCVLLLFICFGMLIVYERRSLDRRRSAT
jgi:hypothetical protein